MAAFIDNVKYRYKVASMPLKFIYINVAVFLLLRVVGVVCFLIGIEPKLFLNFVELPSSFSSLVGEPWTMLTYMFAHYDILHILFNMLVLYWFGRLFLEAFNPKQFAALYIIGGIGGGLLYMLSYSLLVPYRGISGSLIGASASIMAIVIAIAMKLPHYRINLLLFGAVSLKWVAIIYVVIDFLSITGSNSGGHIAHLGGAMCGALFTVLINRGTDITKPINNAIDKLVGWVNSLKQSGKKNTFVKNSKKSSARPDNGTTYSSGMMSKDDEAKLDAILDKIKKSGYTSLTDEEKRQLFQVSNKRQ